MDMPALDDRRIGSFRLIEYLVEATDFEVEALKRCWKPRVQSWTAQSGFERLMTAGTLDGRPVKIAFNWVRINGHLVGFYHPESEVVDYRQIESWLEECCLPPWSPHGPHRCKTVPAHFQSCLEFLEIPLKKKTAQKPRSVA